MPTAIAIVCGARGTSLSKNMQPGKNLFGELVKAEPSLPRSIREMWRVYGKHPLKVCRGCPHLKRKHFNDKHYLKCDVYGDTNGEGTDWRGKWQACGLIDNPNLKVEFGKTQRVIDELSQL